MERVDHGSTQDELCSELKGLDHRLSLEGLSVTCYVIRERWRGLTIQRLSTKDMERLVH